MDALQVYQLVRIDPEKPMPCDRYPECGRDCSYPECVKKPEEE